MTFLPTDAAHLVQHYGYGAVGVAVGIESIGVPFPGETALVAAAIYAGTAPHMQIGLVIAAAIAGAVLGDNVGFWLGRRFGYRLLLRYGRYIRMTEPRIKLGQYLFLRHGGKIVFFGRFIAVLRAAAAFLAGAHGMTWRRFLLFNFAGAAVWATLYGLAAYFVGSEIDRLVGPVGIGLGVAAGLGLAVALVFAWRHEQRLVERAERALPGPVRADPQPV